MNIKKPLKPGKGIQVNNPNYIRYGSGGGGGAGGLVINTSGITTTGATLTFDKPKFQKQQLTCSKCGKVIGEYYSDGMFLGSDILCKFCYQLKKLKE